MKYQDVALIDSHYTLMFFCLLYPDKVDKTLFIVSDGVSQQVRKKLANCLYLPDTKFSKFKKIRELLRNIKYMLSSETRELRKCNNIHFYGQDHAWYSFIGKDKPFTLLEDGLDNYVRLPSKGLKRKILSYFGIPYLEMGRSNHISEIKLTGILPIPEEINDKVKLVDIKEEWERLEQQKKDFISHLFMSKEQLCQVSSLHCDSAALILTQPLNQDGIISEAEKISFYLDLTKKSGINTIYFKRHPRDDTDYTVHDWIELQPQSCPIELFQFIGIDFNTIITFNSTAALKFKKSKILNKKSSICYEKNKI